MLKKLKSLFVVEDEPTANEKAAQASKAKGGNTNKAAKANTNSKAAKPAKFDPSKGKPEEKFVNRLLGALEENNIEGFDYLEYKQALQNLGGVEMDEATKFKSALAMATTMGANTDKLLKSAAHYVQILVKEENKFLDAFKNQQAKQVSSRNQEIKSLEQSITQKEAQIKKLQQEIEAEKKSLENRKTSINQANAKVESTRDNFYHSYHIVKNQIEEDIKKMKQYLT